ncbi:MAG: xanthine dehydrogenase small subunit [Geminicoccaceae bacterium]|nr:xanthine dehydrogenase small subunit [Geminicoccaceae bacterium]
MRHTLRFLLGHDLVELGEVDPTQTVLEWLRRDAHRWGTKEGCAEGDCGACSVVVVRPEGGRLRADAVNSCIQFVGTLDGAQLLTVEDLKGPDGRLHRVQQAMVDHHGSQCGFCTPGFVMALYAMDRRGEAVTYETAVDEIAGNLCRCTGYGPIVEAALAMRGTEGAGEHLSGREAEVMARLEALDDGQDLMVGKDGRTFHAPASLDALAMLYAGNPGAALVAGSTDVGLWVTKQDRPLDPVIWLGRVKELRRIEERTDAVVIGAGVSYTDAMAKLGEMYPEGGELIRRLASVQIRNTGTIGGNVANGSPIGDSPPFLIAADARVVLRYRGERREVAVEDFFISYGEQDRRPGELVEAIVLPRPKPTEHLACYKISKRFDQDISAVCGGFRVRVEKGVVKDARLAFGGMAGTPKRAKAAEAALVGRPWSEDAARDAAAAMEGDFRPLTDQRASAAYRMKVAQNLLVKFWYETHGEGGQIRLVGPRRVVHG